MQKFAAVCCWWLMQLMGLTEVEVKSSAEIMQYLIQRSRSRTTGATAMNSQSSRSHAIFTIYLQGTSRTDRLQLLTLMPGFHHSVPFQLLLRRNRHSVASGIESYFCRSSVAGHCSNAAANGINGKTFPPIPFSRATVATERNYGNGTAARQWNGGNQALVGFAQNRLHTFPCSFPIDSEVANLLQTC